MPYTPNNSMLYNSPNNNIQFTPNNKYSTKKRKLNEQYIFKDINDVLLKLQFDILKKMEKNVCVTGSVAVFIYALDTLQKISNINIKNSHIYENLKDIIPQLKLPNDYDLLIEKNLNNYKTNNIGTFNLISTNVYINELNIKIDVTYDKFKKTDVLLIIENQLIEYPILNIKSLLMNYEDYFEYDDPEKTEQNKLKIEILNLCILFNNLS
jgi:hypothetical protein